MFYPQRFQILPTGNEYVELISNSTTTNPNYRIAPDLEVVLSRLLQTFIFEPSKEEVYWNMTGIATPTVGSGADRKLKMPLKVSLVPA